MLIVAVLGILVVLIALSAVRFARMDPAREQALAARSERKRSVFEGVITARAAREMLPEILLHEYDGECVRVTVERLGETAEERPA